ncbi:MAG: potassium channel family protein [Hominenteromicrobium sp.]
MNIVIMGGGKVGESLARRIMEGRHEVRLIEINRLRCVQIANDLDVEIICGDGTNISTLESAGVRNADCFIAISGNDADNLVASQLAKRHFSARKVIARANDPRNLETMRILGIDYAVSSTEIIAQLIEQEANLMEFHLVASLNKGRGQICSVTLNDRSAVDGMEVKSLVFPKGSLLISIVRGDKLIIPSGNTVLQSGDEIIAVCEERSKKALIKLMNSTKDEA